MLFGGFIRTLSMLKCSQQHTDPRALQQAVSLAWPLLCQARMGTGVNGDEMHQVDLAVGVTAFFADNVTTRTVCWEGSWALIPHGRANVTRMQLAKKALQKHSHSASYWDEYYCHQKAAIISSLMRSTSPAPPGTRANVYVLVFLQSAL